MFLGEPAVHFSYFSPLLPLTKVSPQPSAIPGGNPPGDWQLLAGETPDSNPGLQDNSLAHYHWVTMPPLANVQGEWRRVTKRSSCWTHGLLLPPFFSILRMRHNHADIQTLSRTVYLIWAYRFGRCQKPAVLKAHTQSPCFLYPGLACSFKSPGYTPGHLKLQLSVVLDKEERAFGRMSKT